MDVPKLKMDEFFELLRNNGCTVVSDEHWDKYDVVMMKKDGVTFPVDVEGIYFFPKVVKMCEQLDIPAPEDHQKCYDQIKALKNRDK